MRIRSLILLALSLFLACPALGKDPVSVELATEHTAVGEGEDFQLQVTVHGSRDAKQPIIANAEAFEVQQTGTTSQVQIINGSTSLATTFLFQATPKRPGTFTIGPARLTVDGKTVESGTLAIQVVKGATQPAKESPFRVAAEIDEKAPYVGQQIVYTFRFFSRGRLTGAQLSFPDFNGFLKEELEKQKEYETVQDGARWSVTEIKLALFPQTAGALTIGPATLHGNAVVEGTRRRRGNSPFDQFFDDDFFGMRGEVKRITLRTPPLAVAVHEVPEAGKPAGYAGLIGSFQARALLSKSDVAVGDSVTLTVELSGTGNVRDARLPDLKLEGLKVYDDQPVVKTAVSDGHLGGTKTFKKALVPLKAGTVTVPAIRIPYFDPKAKTYRVAETPPLGLTVAPGTAEEAPRPAAGGQPLSKKDISVVGSDIMPIKHAGAVLSEDMGPGERLAWLLFSLAVCPALWGIAFAVDRARARRRADSGYERRSRAYRKFTQGLDRIAPDADGFAASSALLRGYLGDRFDFDGLALTPIDAERKLRPLRLSDATIRETEELLKLFERAEYGGERLDERTGERLKERLAALAKQVEKEASA